MEAPLVFDESTDVIVIGFGSAGAVAAIEACDKGAEVTLVEKMSFLGGLSVTSGGAMRMGMDREATFKYLVATCGGRTPDDVLEAMAEGMVELPHYIRKLAVACGATISVVASNYGVYPFPGCDSLANCFVDYGSALDGVIRYQGVSQIRAAAKGVHLMKMLEDNVRARSRITVLFETPAQRLLVGSNGEVRGVRVVRSGRPTNIKARRGVILACGGFEADDEMKKQFLQASPVLPGGFRGNTGDGIRMAQEIGAGLWHMWHYHGPFGFKHPDPSFPLAFAMKPIPSWPSYWFWPKEEIGETALSVDSSKGDGAKDLSDLHHPLGRVQLSWILVDQRGRRFMDEYPPYPRDTVNRPFAAFDFGKQRFMRIPAYVIVDDQGRRMYRLGNPSINDSEYDYQWSNDNQKEIDNGILQKAETVGEMALKMAVDPGVLVKTISDWNRFVERGADEEFNRRPDSMVEIKEPPFYFAPVYPLVLNTQGGPVHNARQQVMSTFGVAIQRLYAVGELGSVFGHLYLSGGNLAECVISGWTAGREAAQLQPWDDHEE